MTDLRAIDALIEAVAAGTATMNGFAKVFHSETAYGPTTWGRAHKAFSGSLDAAKSLHETLLPGWWWVKPDGPESGTIRVVGPDNGDCYPSAVGKHQEPARAWLLAILRAYRATLEAAHG